MNTSIASDSPAAQMNDLDAIISTKLDFVFFPQEEDSLLSLRSLLGFVRRLLHVREQFGDAPVDITIPLKREPRCIGRSLSEIIDENFIVNSLERTGYSIVKLKGVNLERIDTIIADCLHYVESRLAS